MLTEHEVLLGGLKKPLDKMTHKIRRLMIHLPSQEIQWASVSGKKILTLYHIPCQEILNKLSYYH